MGWSAWQDGVVLASTAFPVPPFHIVSRSVTRYVDALVDLVPLLEDARLDIVAGGDDVTYSDAALSGNALSTGIAASVNKLGETAETSAGAGLWQGAALIDGSTVPDLDYFPDPLPSLIEGVGYARRPDRGPDDEDRYVQYEPGAPTWTGWADWSPRVDATEQFSNTAGGWSPPPTTVPMTVRAAWVAPLADPVAWHGAELGETLATFTVDHPAAPSGAHLTYTVSIPLSDFALPVTFSLLWQNTGMSGPIPGVDVANGPPIIGWGYQAAAGLILAYAGSGIVPVLPQALYTPPRWRYWLPDAVEPPPPPDVANRYLRMSQRPDGEGTVRHPRLGAAAAQPRLGGANTYA